jgi:hypothetical protein
MAQLQVTRYSSEGISHSEAKSLLITEASDIGLRGFDRLYDDACDVGLELVNPRSGNVTRWYVVDTVVDRRENEVLGWMLKATPETVRKQPELKDYQLNIAND